VLDCLFAALCFSGPIGEPLGVHQPDAGHGVASRPNSGYRRVKEAFAEWARREAAARFNPSSSLARSEIYRKLGAPIPEELALTK